ncbi:MAG: aspartyl protease family protein [Cyclobacteriaceae bacterium]
MPKRLLILLLFSIQLQLCWAQKSIGFVMKSHKAKVTVPFTLINNLVVIPITINNKITLKYILDTGASSPILTERLFGDIIGLNYDREILISGPGIQDSIGAYVSNNNKLQITPEVYGAFLPILVLEQDYIELKKNLGEDIFGIFGYEVFSRFIVKIDYDKLEVTFYDPKKFRKPLGYKTYDLHLENTKPYITSVVKQNDKTDTLKLMVDSGASHALLLDLNESKYLARPDSTLETSLGHGLGGEIPGRIGRFKEYQIGNFSFDDVLVSIPDVGIYSNSIKRGSRHGTVGGAMLKRMNPIIDYYNGKIHLQRSSYYREPFRWDMSGLRISYLENPSRIEITGITPNSPAEDIGLKVGDVVININGMNIISHKLSDIYGHLKRKENRKIRIEVERDHERMRFIFRLRKMI